LNVETSRRPKGSPSANAISREAVDAFFRRSKVQTSRPANRSPRATYRPSAELGSSVTVRLGIAYALNELNAPPAFPIRRLLEVVTELEHHPDNAAPALFGGFVVSGVIDGTIRYRRFNVPPSLKSLCAFPIFPVSTEKARPVAETSVPRRRGREHETGGVDHFGLRHGTTPCCVVYSTTSFISRIARSSSRCWMMSSAAESRRGSAGWLSGSGPGIVCHHGAKGKSRC